MLGTGVNPGFAMDALPITLTASASASTRVTRRPHPGRAHPPAAVPAEDRRRASRPSSSRRRSTTAACATSGLTESIAMIADALGWTLDRITDEIQPKIAAGDGGERVPGGRARATSAASSRTASATRRASRSSAAHGGLPRRAGDVRLRGDRRVAAPARQGAGGIHGDVATASITVNSIPKVLRPRPACTRCATSRCRRSPAGSRGEPMRRRSFLKRTGAGALAFGGLAPLAAPGRRRSGAEGGQAAAPAAGRPRRAGRARLRQLPVAGRRDRAGRGARVLARAAARRARARPPRLPGRPRRGPRGGPERVLRRPVGERRVRDPRRLGLRAGAAAASTGS